MIKALIHRFLNKKHTRKELHELVNELNSNEEAVLASIEDEWERFEINNEINWPEERWVKLHDRINAFKEKDQPEKVFRLQWFTRIAASLIVIATAWFVIDSYRSTGTDAEGPSLITEVNETSEPSIVILKDGTKVTLTAHSSLSYYDNFNHTYRVVHLDGEAYFETDGENKRPFVVISENITSICRGEEFSISAYKESDEINVTLASGNIEISRNDKLNSENNKVAVKSCQRYSFSKTKNEYLIGQISDCDYETKANSMKKAAAKNIVML